MNRRFDTSWTMGMLCISGCAMAIAWAIVYGRDYDGRRFDAGLRFVIGIGAVVGLYMGLCLAGFV